MADVQYALFAHYSEEKKDLILKRLVYANKIIIEQDATIKKFLRDGEAKCSN